MQFTPAKRGSPVAVECDAIGCRVQVLSTFGFVKTSSSLLFIGFYVSSKILLFLNDGRDESQMICVYDGSSIEHEISNISHRN